MNDDDHNDNYFSGHVYKLADELARLIVQEHKVFQAELKQITNLAEDAVRDFGRITTRLSESNDGIRHEQLSCENMTLEKSQSDLKLLSDEINTCTRDTVRTLQFEDILKQLTQHVIMRAEKVDSLFTSLALELENMKQSYDTQSNDNDETRNIIEHIESMWEQIHSFRIALSKSNPVKQSSMKTGKIELF